MKKLFLLLCLLAPLRAFAADAPDLRAVADRFPGCRPDVIQYADAVGGDFDGYVNAAGTTVTIRRGVAPDQLPALVAHELGHVCDFHTLVGTARRLDPRFSCMRNRVLADDPSGGFYQLTWDSCGHPKKGAVFVSDYAKTDPYETFAETYAAVVLKRPLPAGMDDQVRWMKQHVPGL